MSNLLLSLSDDLANRLAGKRWQIEGHTWTFKDFDPNAPESPPWRTGAEGQAYSLCGPDGRVEAYFKSFHTCLDKRLFRSEWLMSRRVFSWLPQTRSAPVAWIDTRHQARPEDTDFDFTGHVAAAAPGRTWQELKQRASRDWSLLTPPLRWRMAEELIQVLAAFENAGFVHGDLEPGNLLVDLDAPDGQPLLHLVDFDAFAVPATPSLGLTVGEGGIPGTSGYMAPELATATERGDVSVCPFSDRYARDLLLLEFLLLGPGLAPEPSPIRWDRRILDNHFQSLLGQSPPRLWSPLRQLDPAIVFKRADQERPSATDLARWLDLPVPTIDATHSRNVRSLLAPAREATELDGTSGEAKWPSTVSGGSRAKRVAIGLTLAVVAVLLVSTSAWYYRARAHKDLPVMASGRTQPELSVSVPAVATGEAFPKGLSPGQYFTNGLGLVFTAVPRTGLLFSIWETRVQDYERFARAAHRPWRKPVFRQTPNHPAANVTRRDAVDFCEWLTATEAAEGRLSAVESYRLPTGSEWSFAASFEMNDPSAAKSPNAGDVLWEAFPWGNQWPPPRGVGNYAPDLGVDDIDFTAPVGSFPPNRYGLFDLGGNVWEWCETGTSRSGLGMLRGGSWRDASPTIVASWWAEGGAPAAAHEFNGFRVVLADQSIVDTVARRQFQPMRAYRATRERSLLTNSLGMEFIPVLGTTLLASIYETRVQDFEAFVRAKPRPWAKPSFPQGPTHPAVNVSWYDAATFCVWLTEHERAANRLGTWQVYRLPTSAEWSWALGLASADGAEPEDRFGRNALAFPWGFSWPPHKAAGNYDPALRVDDFPNTAPVGRFAPGRRGFFDLGGNVWEWCEDTYEPGPLVPVVRGRPVQPSRSARVMRGAAWNVRERALLASAYRARSEPAFRSEALGFRVVLEDQPTNLGE